MTAVQIFAVLGLLLAFGVPKATVNNIQTILERSAPSLIPTLLVAESAVTPEPLPIPIETCNLALTSKGGEHTRFQWGTNTMVENYVYQIGITNTCNKSFVVDYQGSAWETNELNTKVVVPEKYSIQGSLFRPWYTLQEMNPIAGTYTATLVAHTIDGTATSSPIQITYTSHGVLTDSEFNAL